MAQASQQALYWEEGSFSYIIMLRNVKQFFFGNCFEYSSMTKDRILSSGFKMQIILFICQGSVSVLFSRCRVFYTPL